MTDENAEPAAVDIDGLGLDDAVDAVVDAKESLDPDAVRETLEEVVDDDVVRQSSARDRLADLEQVVQSARGNANMATFELRKAEQAAESVTDLDAVRSRLEDFETEVAMVTDRADDVEDRLETLTDRVEDPDSLYEFLADVEDAIADAEDVEANATHVWNAVQDFEEWLDDPEAWVADLRGDAHAVDDTLDAIEEVVDDLAAAVEAGDDAVESVPVDDPGAVWLDLTLRLEVVELMLGDVRSELSDLRELAERFDETDDWSPAIVGDTLDDLDDRRAALSDRVDDLGRPEWRDRFEEQLATFDEAVDGMESPIDWMELRSTLDAIRATPQSDQ